MPQLDLHKQGIARTFGRAAGDYDRYAALQRSTGAELAMLLGPLRDRLLVDAGCGTGWFSSFWRHAGNRVIALDLSPAMLAQARLRQCAELYLAGDIEQLPLATGSVDVCFSNLAVQWCDDLPRALAEFYRVTRPGGLIALSTLADGSLGELQQAWSQVDSAVHMNQFMAEDDLRRVFAPYRHRMMSTCHRLHYPNITALLRELKGVGAGYLRQGRSPGLTSRQCMERLNDAWPRQTEGLPLSYHLIYGIIYRD